MEDLTLRRLTKKILPYIWLRHKLISSITSHGLFPFSEVTYFSQQIGKAAIVYLHMYRPMLAYYLEKHISSMPQSKMHFWTHVALLCLQVRLADDQIFDYFLTVCSVTAEVALHCYMNGYEEVLPYASVFLCAFFETELYEGFHKAGGWLELHRYIQNTSCIELYEMVDSHLERIESPSDHLHILISIKQENLAAERREKFLSLRSFKIGEVERDEKVKSLVSGILNWDFMENERISEIKPGILKRMENIRHKKKKSNISLSEGKSEKPQEADSNIRHKKKKSNISLSEGKSEKPQEADSIMDTENTISNVDKLLCHIDEAQPLEYITTMFERPSNFKSEQILNKLKYTEVRKESHQLCTNNELSDKRKSGSSSNSSSSSNASAPTESKISNSKRFRSSNKTLKEFKLSTIKGMSNEKVRNFERCQKFIPYTIENSRTIPKKENLTPETAIELFDSFYWNPLYEVSKSFEKLGYSCLCVGNSSYHDERFSALTNYSEIIDKCHHFQNKYPSIQFAFLIPNEYFKEKKYHASVTESCNKIHFEEQYNEQQTPIAVKNDFKNNIDSSQGSQSGIKNPEFCVDNLKKNQFSFLHEPVLLQNCMTGNIQKSSHVSKVEENDLISRGKSFQISRFSVTKVNENQMLAGNEANWMENVCMIEPVTASRLRTGRAFENQLKDQIDSLDKNCLSEATKISRLTVTEIDENKSKEEKCMIEKNWGNETTKISRFTVTKINENKSKDPVSILRKNLSNETTKISRFTVTKINENKAKYPVSILRKNLPNETTKISRFIVKKVPGDPLISKASTSLLRKSSPTITTNISRFSVTKVDEKETKLLEENYSSSSEIFDDAENETVQFQENGSVKYQKRVSFSEIPFISFYHPYSSDESPNSSKTSRESLNQNSPEETQSSKDIQQIDSKKDISRTPILRNTVPQERQGLFRHHTFNDSQTSRDNVHRSNTSFALNRLGKFFRSSSGSNKNQTR